jgi:chorismate mutase/prephenate dehydratase
VFIVGETYLKVQHYLMVSSKNPVTLSSNLKTIKKVYSHPKALEQCTDFFKKHSWMTAIPYADTADAAKLVSQSDDNSVACIAGLSNADIHNLKVVAKNLESNPNNHTRFIVIANKLSISPTANKCTIEIGLPHVPGSLSNVFATLTANECNLTKIESRPIHGKPFEYIFYLDFLFDPKKHEINESIKRIKGVVLSLRLLGIYKDTRPSY